MRRSRLIGCRLYWIVVCCFKKHIMRTLILTCFKQCLTHMNSPCYYCHCKVGTNTSCQETSVNIVFVSNSCQCIYSKFQLYLWEQSPTVFQRFVCEQQRWLCLLFLEIKRNGPIFRLQSKMLKSSTSLFVKKYLNNTQML